MEGTRGPCPPLEVECPPLNIRKKKKKRKEKEKNEKRKKKRKKFIKENGFFAAKTQNHLNWMMQSN